MKKKEKKLTLDEAEDGLLDIVAGHLATLPPDEAKRRIKKIHQVTLGNDDRDTGSRSSGRHSTSPTPLLARKR